MPSLVRVAAEKLQQQFVHFGQPAVHADQVVGSINIDDALHAAGLVEMVAVAFELAGTAGDAQHLPRCPPADSPTTPMRSGSTFSRAALARNQRTAVLASQTAAGKGRPVPGDT